MSHRLLPDNDSLFENLSKPTLHVTEVKLIFQKNPESAKTCRLENLLQKL